MRLFSNKKRVNYKTGFRHVTPPTRQRAIRRVSQIYWHFSTVSVINGVQHASNGCIFKRKTFLGPVLDSCCRKKLLQPHSATFVAADECVQLVMVDLTTAGGAGRADGRRGA